MRALPPNGTVCLSRWPVEKIDIDKCGAMRQCEREIRMEVILLDNVGSLASAGYLSSAQELTAPAAAHCGTEESLTLRVGRAVQ